MNSKMLDCELSWPLDKCYQIENIFHVPNQKTQLHAAFHFSYISKTYGLLFRKAVLLHFLHDAVNQNVHVR